MSFGTLPLMFGIVCAAALNNSHVQGQTPSLSPQDSPTAVKGKSFQFTCTVSGSDSLSGALFFTRGSSPTASPCVVNSGTCSQFRNSDGYSCACVNGQTRVFFMNITSVRRVDDDNWRCQYSIFTSNIVSLDVHYPPAITSVPSSKDVTENTRRNINCNSNITPGNPVSTSYRWTGPVGYNKTGAVFDRTVTRTQGGQYTCTATNTAGLSDTATVNINIQYAPIITAVPSSTNVGENTRLNIDCNSNITPGNPSSTSYSWTGPGGYSKPGTVLDRTVTRTQGGQYTCTATNTAGLSDTAKVNINVQYIPRISITPANTQTKLEGGNLTLACSADSYPDNAVLSWMFAGTTLPGLRVVKTNLKSSDQGEYRCTGTANTGSVCPNGHLQGNNHVVVLVYSSPPVPEDLIAFSTASHTIKLSWKVTSVSGIKQQFFIEYKEDGLDWKMSKELYNETGKEFVQGYVTDLKLGTLYFLRVKAIADIGICNFTDVVRVFTIHSPQSMAFQNGQETNTGKVLIGVGIVMIILGILFAAMHIFVFFKQKRSQGQQKQESYDSFQSRDGNTYDEIQRSTVYQNTEFSES